MAPIASTTLTLVAEEFLNNDFEFSVTFDNTGLADDDIGYAPFFDLTVPFEINFNPSGATYLGTPIDLEAIATWNATAGQWEDSNDVAVTEHPFDASLALPPDGVVDGDTWYLVELPFGSFAPSQPGAEVLFTGSTLNKALGAEVGTGLNITARGGFQFGADPLDNPGSDAPIQENTVTASTITPIVISLDKGSSAAEDETATGSNFPVTYTITVDIADDETINNLVLTEVLPDNLAYVGGTLTVTGASFTANDLPADGVASLNNDFVLNFGNVTGGAGEDIVITYQAFVPEFDADGNPVIDPNTGDAVTALNEARVDGTYLGNPVSEGLINTANGDDGDFELEVDAIAIQKGGSVVGGGDVIPGANLQYTLNFQVSDFFNFDQVVITDVLSDGQRFDSSVTPTLVITGNDGNPISSPVNFTGDNFTDVINAGVTTLTFDVSALLQTEVGSAILRGDVAAGTTGQIVYETTVQQDFSNDFPSGDPSVDAGDVLDNQVNITGQVVDDFGTPLGDTETEGSGASFTVDSLDLLEISVYAVDGQTIGISNPAQVNPSGTITYRLRAPLPSLDIDDLNLTAFLPLPITDTDDLTIGAISGTGIPLAGQVSFGPDYNLNTFTYTTGAPNPQVLPLTSLESDSNSVVFQIGTFDSTISQPGTPVVDLLFTLNITDELFADALLLTAQGVLAYGNTDNDDINLIDISLVEFTPPVLTLTKAAVSTNAASPNFTGTRGPVTFNDPDSGGSPFTGSVTSAALSINPIDSDLTGIDANDSVRMALVIENTGAREAFDVLIKDVLPTGFENARNLTVTDGAGNAIGFSGDLFGAGLELVNTTDGAIAEGRSGSTPTADGSNIIIITYDVTASDAVEPNQPLTGNAEILEFSAREGTNDLTVPISNDALLNLPIQDWTDPATVRVFQPSLTLDFTDSSEDSTADDDLTIGEVATYQATVTLPEGEANNLDVVIDIPNGMQLTGTPVLRSPGFNGTINNDGGTPLNDGDAVSVTGGAGSGDDVTFSFGTINTTADPGSTENTFIIEYQAVVLDESGNADGDSLTHNATLFVDNGDSEGDAALTIGPDAATIQVIEPTLTIATNLSPGTADAGDRVTITLMVTNTGNADAFETIIENPIDTTRFTNIAAETTPTIFSYNFDGSTVTYTATAGSVGAIADGSPPLEFTFTADLLTEVEAGDTLVNIATITQATTLPNTDANERDLPDVNDSDTVTIDSPAIALTLLDTEIDATNNSDTEAVIGETVQYEVVLTLPEGTTPNATILNTLPAGLGFVSLDSVTPSSGDINIASTDPAVVLAAPTSTNGSGNQEVTFNLGTLTNTNIDDGTAETITLVYTAVVLNTTGNQDSTTLSPTVAVDWDTNPGAALTSTAANVSVIEPDYAITQSAVVGGSGTTGDAGDEVVYTITFTHQTGTPDAFEVNLTDTLPTKIINPTITNVTDSASTLGTGDFSISAGTLQTVSDIDTTAGRTITVEVTGELSQSVVPNELIDNTANLTWSSLNGTVGDRSTFATNDGERTGADGVGSGLNNYGVEDTAQIEIVNVAPAKSVTSTSEAHTTGTGVAIGEIVRYRLVTTLSESTLTNVQLRDTLPAGLEFIDDGTALVAFVNEGTNNLTLSDTTLNGAVVSNETSSFTPTFALPADNISTSGNQVTFTLGTITNSGTNSGNEFVIMEFNARVLNNAANQSLNNATGTATPTTLDNAFEFLVDSTVLATSNTSSIQILEPRVTLSQSLTSTAPQDAGDTVTYELVLTNTGDADAFDINLANLLDADLDLVSATQTGSTGTVGAVTITENSPTTDDVAIAIASLDEGASITFTIQATVADAADAGATITNTPSLSYTSLPDSGTAVNPTGSAPVTERTGADGVGGLNDYATQASPLNNTLVTPTVTKVISGTNLNETPGTNVAVGEEITYTVTITVPEGELPTLQLADVLEPGLAIAGIDSITPSAGLSTDVAGGFGVGMATIGAPGGSTADIDQGRQLDINFGTVTNTNRDDGTAETITVTYRAIAINDVTVQNGTPLDSQATLTWTGDGAGTDNATSGAVTLVEPNLSIDRQVLDGATPAENTLADPGDTVTVRLTIDGTSASSTADAFDVVVTEQLPTGLNFVGSPTLTTVSGPSPTNSSFVGDTLTVNYDSLADGAESVLEFDVVLDAGVSPNQVFTDSTTLTYTSLPGDPGVITANNPLAVERTGNPGDTGSAANDFSDTDPATITVKDVPALDLDGDDSISSGTGFSAIFTPSAGGVAIADTDSDITDPDDTDMESATITLTNRLDGTAESLTLTGTAATLAGTLGITVTPYNSATGILQLTGTATKDDYETLIQGIQYNNTSRIPINTSRTITVVVNDGAFDSNTATATIHYDSDGDGVANIDDLDDDNDGILDTVEITIDPDLDTDGDGLLDWQDPDAPGFVDGNGDNVDDRYDFDGDSIPNYLDIDSDNDGIVDVIEAGGSDPDGNGRVGSGGTITDSDGDGVDDSVDEVDSGSGAGEVTSGTALTPVDTDTDGNLDYLDIDADDDGIPDNIEAQPTDSYIAPTGTDTDGDGLDDAYDADETGSTPITTPENTDGIDSPDYLDTDSDNDGLTDGEENGWPASTPSGTDTDGDGLDDAFEGGNLNDGFDVNDEIDDPTSSVLPDTDGDLGSGGDLNYRDVTDTDSDGVPDPIDLDDDNDGILDTVELDGLDPDQDSDGDGAPDWQDPDAPGFVDDNSDGIDDRYDPDGDGTPNHLDIDADDDGIPDNIEAQPTDSYVAPDGTDTDGDGLDDAYDSDDGGTPITTPENTDGLDTPDYLDTDSDNDGLTDGEENGWPDSTPSGTDTDGDGLDDAFEGGNLNDGFDVNDEIDAPTSSVLPDTDGDLGSGGDLNYRDVTDTDSDGVPDPIDLDDDNDGILDTVELDGLDPDQDSDGDGAPDWQDSDAPGFVDDNSDGIDDRYDPDGDGTPNHLDIDADDDGIPDNIEAQPTDSYVAPDGTDTDGDGLDDAYDSDDGGTPITTPENTDGIDTPDYLDTDSDNDGLTDGEENGWLASTPSGTDTDGDGLDDAFEGSDASDGFDVNDEIDDPTDLSRLPDTDGDLGSGGDLNYRDVTDTDSDGVPDPIDLDDDNDGILDTVELDGLDPDQDSDGDGAPDWQDPDAPGFVDDNSDGIDDRYDPDGDGTPNHLDIDADDDGIPDNIEAQPTDSYVAPTGTDTDGDGLDDAYDSDNGGTPISVLENTDSTDTPDYLDTDSDNDGLTDGEENGWLASTPSGTDTDGDGLDDAFEGSDANDGFDVNDEIDDPTSSVLPDTDGDLGSGGDLNYRDVTDTDSDGVPDPIDLDDDNDGILDTVELDGLDPDQDSDGDGAPDWQDPDAPGFVDDNSDGIDDRYDPDGDSTPNHLDIDSDNDGIVDVIEAGSTDTDGDGRIDPLGDGTDDADSDGVIDRADPDEGGTTLTPVDTDTDGNLDYLDIDSDDDGIPDNIEAQPTDSYVAPNGTDADGDGLDDAYDADETGSTPITTPENTDGLDSPDYLDTDSDNDGLTDGEENGWPDSTPSGTDTDGDGLDDAFEGSNANDGFDVNDEIDDPTSSVLPDTDGDLGSGGDLNYRDVTDTDGDGVPDPIDLDDDNDGILDTDEIAIDPDLDSDGDGAPDWQDPDPANDLNSDGIDDRFDTDGDGTPDHLDLDADNDGINDVVEAGHGQPDANNDGILDGPFGANGLADSVETTPESSIINYTIANHDSDPNPDFQDLDSDNDTLPDLHEGGSNGNDVNNDGVVDGPDTDGDGIQDSVDGTPDAFGDDSSPVTPNSDSDSQPDYIDIDQNDDGLNDIAQANNSNLDTNDDGEIDDLTDNDADGIPDVIDDSDLDGITDNTDADPQAYGGLPILDTDGDGVIDFDDLDDDNDGIVDTVEQNGDLLRDTDSDGIIDSLDLDADDDGIPDVIEAGHEAADADQDGRVDGSPTDFGDNGLLDSLEDAPDSGTPTDTPVDTDGDTVADFQELDSDNDGINDVVEGGGTDLDGNGLIDGAGTDTDGDGLADSADNSPLPVPDTDGDQRPDYQDLDADNDGVPDLIEGGLDPSVVDTDGDSVIDGPDTDGDGIQDPTDGTPSAYGDSDGPASDTLPDADMDDIPDYRELDSDNNGTPDRQEAGLPSGLDTPDANGDGQVDNPEDFDRDGIADTIDSAPSTYGSVEDTDGDGVPNVTDIDDDNDGILDEDEALGDPTRDTDGDGIIDSLDLDADDDGIPDLYESGLKPNEIRVLDADADGVIDLSQIFGDNGFADGVETTPESGQPDYDNNGVADQPVDTDKDGIDDFQDLDSDSDGITDSIEANSPDADGDGRVDDAGVDGDRDGLADTVDPDNGGQLPTIPDTDGDAIADFRDLDSDDDGLNDVVEGGGRDTDGNGLIDGVGTDTNTDGLADSVNTSPLPIPDTDTDDRPDFRDLDTDNDGLADLIEGGLKPLDVDKDGNGVVDGVDTDGDGIRNSVDGTQTAFGDNNGPGGNTLPNADGDTLPDYREIDSDNDGIPDRKEGGLPMGAGTPDVNQDGVVDNPTDADKDGIADAIDIQPGVYGGIDSKDTDRDGVSDLLDLDDDNDGIPDQVEQAGDPEKDTDGDGVIDSLDLDSDNDGITDVVEAGHGASDSDQDGQLSGPFGQNGFADSLETTPEIGVPNYTPIDTDGDSVADFRDLDSDNDGITDVIEAGGSDPDGDGIIGTGSIPDVNENGLSDSIDISQGGTPLSTPDQDQDGMPDFRDLDSDNDGITDLQERGGDLPDSNGDGQVDSGDTDGDGLVDLIDGNPSGFGSSGVPIPAPKDSDGDGIPDFRELPNPNNSGSQGSDNITGTDGNDILNGFSDLDILDGGAGDDIINGGSSKDTLVGGPGNDTLNGGSNNDKMDGGPGNDILNGGSGNDKMFGRDGNDILNGGPGKDKLWGGKGNDIINGSGSRDRLFGDEGKDKIRGNGGNDIIVGGFQKDELTGGQGKDKFRYTSIKDFKDTITDFEILKDKLDVRKIKGVSSMDDVAFNQRGDDLLIKLDTNKGMKKFVTLLDVDAETMSDRHFMGL